MPKQNITQPPTLHEESLIEIPQKMRSLWEIYAESNEINDFVIYCLFAHLEPLTFEVAIKNEQRRLAIDEEINAFKRMTIEMDNSSKRKANY